MDKLKNIWKFRGILLYLPSSIYFNFHYLPFKQAIKLPILLYKPKLISCKGKIEIDSKNIKFGMIRLGFYNVTLYPNTGFLWENHGGSCVFKGKCNIGNDSKVSIGKYGKLEFGKDFIATAAMKIAAYHNIKFSDKILVGWECTFIDTDFHKTFKLNREPNRAFSPIYVGENNWFAFKCIVLKGTETPKNCIIGANSVLNKKYNDENILIAGASSTIKSLKIYRNPLDDSINYYEK